EFMKLLTLFSLLLLALPGFAANKKFISVSGTEEAALPYSQGIIVDNTLYVSGQTGEDEKGEYPKNFEQEVHNTFKNIGLILKAAGYDYKDVIDTKVYLTDMKNFDTMNKVYVQYFKDKRPVRATLGVKSLVGKARIEITVIAKK